MPVDQETFREAMSHWASGVAVVTTFVDGVPHGMTASAFCSVSTEPPTILVCVSKQARTHDRILRAGRFGVNILASTQQAYAVHFAGTPVFEGNPPFLCEDDRPPAIADALAFLECRVAKTCDAGTHTIFLGLVESCRIRPGGKPLTYYRRSYRQLLLEDDEE
jgi:flavin reductase (DIM6/NTAB) family NADH-FMN oxidoreductase RutF